MVVINSLIGIRKEILTAYGAIIDAITDCAELEAERAELNAECDVSMELLRK